MRGELPLTRCSESTSADRTSQKLGLAELYIINSTRLGGHSLDPGIWTPETTAMVDSPGPSFLSLLSLGTRRTIGSSPFLSYSPRYPMSRRCSVDAMLFLFQVRVGSPMKP